MDMVKTVRKTKIGSSVLLILAGGLAIVAGGGVL